MNLHRRRAAGGEQAETDERKPGPPQRFSAHPLLSATSNSLAPLLPAWSKFKELGPSIAGAGGRRKPQDRGPPGQRDARAHPPLPRQSRVRPRDRGPQPQRASTASTSTSPRPREEAAALAAAPRLAGGEQARASPGGSRRSPRAAGSSTPGSAPASSRPASSRSSPVTTRDRPDRPPPLAAGRGAHRRRARPSTRTRTTRSSRSATASTSASSRSRRWRSPCRPIRASQARCSAPPPPALPKRRSQALRRARGAARESGRGIVRNRARGLARRRAIAMFRGSFPCPDRGSRGRDIASAICYPPGRRMDGPGGRPGEDRGREMAVPKSKVTRAKRGMRRSHDALVAGNPNECPNCGELRRPHHVAAPAATTTAARSWPRSRKWISTTKPPDPPCLRSVRHERRIAPDRRPGDGARATSSSPSTPWAAIAASTRSSAAWASR